MFVIVHQFKPAIFVLNQMFLYTYLFRLQKNTNVSEYKLLAFLDFVKQNLCEDGKM